MKPPGGADSAPQMDVAELFTELRGSLRGSRGDGSRLQRRRVCDRILRLCVELMAQPGVCPQRATSLVTLAEEACQGYLASSSSSSQPPSLYLEKILYHLLKNAAARGSVDACWRVADLLRDRLLGYQGGRATASKDFVAIAYNAYGLLWKRAEVLAHPDRPREEGRGLLSVRLRALRFLLLLEKEEEDEEDEEEGGGVHSTPHQPPFFNSRTAQQVAAAAALYQAQESPSPAFLARQIGEFLLAPLREEKGRGEKGERDPPGDPPGLRRCLCFFELTLERCRHLCKSGWFLEAEKAVKEARDYLKATKSFGDPLILLETGVQLSQALAGRTGQAGPLLSRAAVALGEAEVATEPFLGVLAESCQLLVAPLGELVKRSKEKPLGRGDTLGLSAFTQGHCRLLRRLLERVPPEKVKAKLMVKQLLYYSLQLFTTLAYDALQGPQPLLGEHWSGLEQLLGGCRRSVAWMVEALEGLPESEGAKYLDVTALCTFKLSYIFYHLDLHKEAIAVSQPLCHHLEVTDPCPQIPPETLHKCFRLRVESYRKLGKLGAALESVVGWLVALVAGGDRGGHLLSEPLALWVRVKTEAGRRGEEEIRLRTLREALGGRSLGEETLVTLLLGELRAYKGARGGDTGQERYDTLCHLLELCPPRGHRLHPRAVGLRELAQLLCYHAYPQQTEWSPLDSVRESLRLLELVPSNSQNRDQLLDDRAQALLWLYVCTLEAKLEKGIERDQRLKALGSKPPEDFEHNDLGSEGRLLEEKFLYDGVAFNLATDSDVCKHLDDAFSLWKELLGGGTGVPAVRCPEETVTSLRLTATLYKLMAKPLEAMETYLLLSSLCDTLGDSLGTAGALCHVTKLLLQLECPTYAQLFLEKTESHLGTSDNGAESYLLLQQTCLLLRCQLCCANGQVEEGLGLLLGLLQNPTLRKATRGWYLLRAHLLQLVALYLGLPPARLPPQLRQRIVRQGWRTPEAALSEAHKIFRSITFLLGGGDIWGGQTPACDPQFGHYCDSVVLKWEVLGDILACSEKLVAHLGQLEVVCKAKAFCLDAIKLAIKLQAIRWCGSFMVLKAQLELQQNELALSDFDLQQVLYLLESPTEFNTSEKQESPKEILPRKGKLKGKKPPNPPSPPPEEEEGFLKGPPMELVATVSGSEPGGAPLASPELKPPPKMKSLTFLAHPEPCSCPLCSDPLLSALCLRWLLAHARLQLAQGNQTEGLGLIRALLPRCATVATRFATLLRDKPWRGDTHPQDLPSLDLLNDLVATSCATLALQSLATPQLEEELERGFTLLASCRPHVPNLEVSRATLLLAKAVATACHARASEHDDPVDAILASSCTFQLPALPPEEPQVATVPQNLKMRPQRRQTKAAPAPPGPKPGGKKSQKPKPPSLLKADDSEAEVATLAGLPATTVPCAAATPACRTPFTIFSESSPLATKSRLLRAPKASRRVKSRLKVVFSDNSDGEDPPSGQTSSSSSSSSAPPKALPPKSVGPGGGGTQHPRRGRRGRPRAGATEEKKERATGKRAEEKDGGTDPLRAIKEEEEEKVEEELDVSFKVLQEEEEGAPGRTRRPRHKEDDEGGPAPPNSGHPPPLGGAFSCPPPAAAAVPSLATTLQELLQRALACISHCPPPTLYSHICRLLALALGHRHPLATASLLSESFSVTTRHQLLSVIHRKIHKEKKAGGDIGDRLGGLSLQEGTPAQRCHHLTQLQGLFAFDAPGGANGEGGDTFRAHLQHIPPGVTVCLLTLANVLPGRGGDTLLVTRLERDVPPLTVPIPTARGKVPLSSVLRDFDDILKGQKEANACRDKEDWWLHRSQLDQRMKNLIEELERQVLGCWRGVLLPSGAPPQEGLEEEVALLHPQLLGCGWRDPHPPLLKVILNAAPLLAPPDVQALAFGLCPAAPQEAQLLLQKALKKRSCPKKSSGSLVLVLDKHLQKLPWESMGCLRTVPVTRLPSLRFLLAYSLAQKQGAGSVLSRGMNPTSAFYVLNPHRNLPGTEERFRDWFESEPGWKGVTGIAPSTKQMEAALTQHDLYIYVGHGAGARFLDGQAICRLDCRAVVLLFGCSSAALALRGDLEASGIILKYIMAGCPLVLGNLWDVTDRDLDRFAQALLGGWLRGGPRAPLLPHVTQARQAPRLKHLIGAAPVAYGLPVCLQ